MTNEQMTALINGDAETLASFGLDWTLDSVSKQSGPNATSKVIVGSDAQILTITDVSKFLTNFPNAEEILGGIANGTSLRVTAQGVNRDHPDWSVEKRRSAIVNRLLGIRNAGARGVKVVERIVEVTTVTHALPGGGTYAGSDVTEYRQAIVGALSEMGVAVPQAIEIANTFEL